MARDPVCGMEVDERGASFYTRLSGGETLYFCSGRCKSTFDHGPEAEVTAGMSWWERFLKRLGDSGKERYGGKPPSCH